MPTELAVARAQVDDLEVHRSHVFGECEDEVAVEPCDADVRRDLHGNVTVRERLDALPVVKFLLSLPHPALREGKVAVARARVSRRRHRMRRLRLESFGWAIVHARTRALPANRSGRTNRLQEHMTMWATMARTAAAFAAASIGLAAAVALVLQLGNLGRVKSPHQFDTTGELGAACVVPDPMENQHQPKGWRAGRPRICQAEDGRVESRVRLTHRRLVHLHRH